MDKSARLFYGYLSGMATFMAIALEVALFHNFTVSSALAINGTIIASVGAGVFVYRWLGRSIQ